MRREADPTDHHEGHQGRTVATSTAYISHVLDDGGVPPRELSCTRLADLVNTIDLKLAAAAFGIKPESVMFYLADHVNNGPPAVAGERHAGDQLCGLRQENAAKCVCPLQVVASVAEGR